MTATCVLVHKQHRSEVVQMVCCMFVNIHKQ